MERGPPANAVRKLEEIGPDLPYPPFKRCAALLACGSYGPGAGSARGRRFPHVAATSSSPQYSPNSSKDPRGFRQACERALQRLAELKRNDHNGEAIQAVD